MVNGQSDAEVYRDYESIEKAENERKMELAKAPLLDWFEQVSVYTDPVTSRPSYSTAVSIKSMLEPVEGGDLVGLVGEFLLPLIGLYDGRKMATRGIYLAAKESIARKMAAGREEDAKKKAERAGPQAGPRYEEQMRQMTAWQSQVDEDLRFLKVTSFDERYARA